MARRRVLLIGWDAADWKVIQPLVDAGWLPNLARLIERGTMGNLATLQPALSPMLWSSIATGKRPYKHGVLGFSEVVPESGVVRPVSSLSRKTKAIWNILHQEGKTCHVVGWWPSHPVEPLRGAMVSNHFHVATAALDKPWPLAAGTVHPPEMAQALAALRIHPHELDGDMLRPFVPRAPEIDQEKDKRLGTLAKLVAECASVHAAATHILAGQPDWDFAAVYYDALDHFSHAFMRYHPPRLDWVSAADFDLYSGVLGGAYVLHDTMLGTLLALAGAETTVILVSDHGFHPDQLRPRMLPNEPAGPAAEHRPFGIFVAAGPGLREDALLYSASILDVTPTVLSLFDLPLGRDMDGRALTAIYKEAPALNYIASWDDVPGDAAMLNGAAAAVDSEAAAAMIRQLAELGYIDAPGADRQTAIDQTVREERYNLARALLDGGRGAEAAAVFADLWERWPDESRFGVHLLQTQIGLGHILEARATMNLLRPRKQAAAAKAQADMAQLTAALRKEQGLPETPANADDTLDPDKLNEEQQQKLRQLQRRAATNPHAFAYLEGALLAAEGRFGEALSALDGATGVQASQQPALHLKRGEIQMALKRPATAMQEYALALELDPVNPAARLGLARAAFTLKDFRRAAAEARAAIGCRYHFPQAHLIAGMALWRGGQPAVAEGFLRSAVALNPVFPAGHRLLATFLERVTRDPQAAAEHRRLAAESRTRIQQWQAGIRPEGQHPAEYRDAFGQPPPLPPHAHVIPPAHQCVVVVTGLPRSGTSMMMQMLNAGGFPVLADDQRLADESNPRGYLEFAPAKKIVRDATWVAGAVGKAVKIVSPLVIHLPAGPIYRIIQMQRPVREVVASQRAVLARLGKEGSPVSDDTLFAIYERQCVTTQTWLAHLHYKGAAAVLTVSYLAALEDPAGTAARLACFLGGDFDEQAAAQAVDRALHRSK